ncbi:MAG: translesion DNA synthesis-associated protein ImuA [Pseudomonadota bacterium]
MNDLFADTPSDRPEEVTPHTAAQSASAPRPVTDTPPTNPNPMLDALLDHGKLWRGGQMTTNAHVIPTGHAVLDPFLPGGGWPRAALTEILLDGPGSGELQLVLPALKRLCAADSHDSDRWISWIAPPYVPYAPALAQAGINLARMLVVHARKGLDVMWAAEQSLRCGTCSAVLMWAPNTNTKALRRLQLAAEEGDSWGVVFRETRTQREASPAAVRLRLSTNEQGRTLHLLKSRGGRPLRVAADFLMG